MKWLWILFFFFFQAEDGIRDHAQSRGLGDVYKRQVSYSHCLVSQYFQIYWKTKQNILKLQRPVSKKSSLFGVNSIFSKEIDVDLQVGQIIIRQKKYTQKQINKIKEFTNQKQIIIYFNEIKKLNSLRKFVKNNIKLYTCYHLSQIYKQYIK
eukprot:TRINITY_DN8767_c0_g1_i1.p2 TRINITY_DN8767_c0_g1~~TRINITY_DN8767_c0_g1_i1.p2  ORF type:complete len:152 (-),score=26.68 TRINITY_DN8767_c0_g1_i1:229-684(-)